MNIKINWLRQPKYSLLNLVVFFLVGFGTTLATTYHYMLKDRAWARAAVLVSPLPKVVAAPSAFITDKDAYQKQYEFSENWFTDRIPARLTTLLSGCRMPLKILRRTRYWPKPWAPNLCRRLWLSKNMNSSATGPASRTGNLMNTRTTCKND